MARIFMLKSDFIFFDFEREKSFGRQNSVK